MKISHIIPVILLSLGIIGGVLYAAGINLPWGSPESSSSGYLSPTSGGTKDIALAGGGCVKVTSTTGTQYFIPTRTAGEIASFTGHLPPGITTNTCTEAFCTVYYAKNFGHDYEDFELGIGDSVGPFMIYGTKFYTTCTAYGGARCQETDPRSDYNAYLCTIPTNGSCGSANGATTATYPTSNHCSVGTKLDIDTVATAGTYDWRCDGSGGGSNVNCSANKLVSNFNGQCGLSHDNISIGFPTSNHCSVGTKVDADTTGSDGTYNWTCKGGGTGSDVSCTAYREDQYCEYLHPVSWDAGQRDHDRNLVVCTEYYLPPDGTLRRTFHKVGTQFNISGGYCPYQSMCYGDMTLKCEVVSGHPRVSTVTKTCNEGARP